MILIPVKALKPHLIAIDSGGKMGLDVVIIADHLIDGYFCQRPFLALDQE
jgi:hypothetical protein